MNFKVLVFVKLNPLVGFVVSLYIFQKSVGIHHLVLSMSCVMKTGLTHERAWGGRSKIKPEMPVGLTGSDYYGGH